MALSHIAEHADASIGIYERENKIDFGLIEFDADESALRLSGKTDEQILCQYGSLYSSARGRAPPCDKCRLSGHAKPAAEDQSQ